MTWLLIVYLFTPGAGDLPQAWKMEVKGEFKTEAGCRAMARVEQQGELPLEGGRVVTCIRKDRLPQP